jgi:PIN domain nuclease of toxin-antitoxin system
LLLDSHVLLWLDTDPHFLSASQRQALLDLENEVYVSAATAWELGIKQKKGQLILLKPVAELRLLFGFRELSITMAHGELAASLPLHHKDPFDRMLVAQAILERMVRVTADSELAQYPSDWSSRPASLSRSTALPRPHSAARA